MLIRTSKQVYRALTSWSWRKTRIEKVREGRIFSLKFGVVDAIADYGGLEVLGLFKIELLEARECWRVGFEAGGVGCWAFLWDSERRLGPAVEAAAEAAKHAESTAAASSDRLHAQIQCPKVS